METSGLVVTSAARQRLDLRAGPAACGRRPPATRSCARACRRAPPARRPGRPRRAGAPRPPAAARRERRHSSASAESAVEAAHSSVGSRQRLAQPVDLLRAEHRGVVQRVAGDRQAPALDREGEDDAGPLGLGVAGLEPGDDVAEVVAGEVARAGRRGRRRGRRRAPRASFARCGWRAPASSPSRISLPGRRSMLWYSPFGISSMRRRSVSPPSSANAARRRGPYFSVTTCQPWSANTRRELRRADAGHHAVEALAVEVDDPGHAPEAARGGVGDGLPDVALVELRVADQRHEAPPAGEAEVRVEVAVDDAGEEGRRRAEADRAGGEVDGVGILGARGVGLQAAEVAQRRSGTRGRAGPAGS